MYQPEDFGGFWLPKYLTLVLFSIAGMCSAVYMITALTVIGHCYYEPCYEGGGIIYVWKVNASISWPAIMFGLALLFTSAWGWYQIAKKNVTEDIAGIMTGCSVWGLVCAFCNCCTWGTENIIMQELIKDHPTQEESHRSMKVNQSLQSPFVGLTVYSSFIFICYAVICFQLLFKRKQLLGSPGASAGAAYGSEYTPFGNNNGLPEKAHSTSPDATGYNDL